MITTNPAWDAKNAALAKKPIYLLTISGVSTVYSTHDLTREGITGTLPTHQPWLKTPRGASQAIDVLAGTSSIGELECEVIDPSGAVRQLVGTNTLEGRTAILSVGYPGIAYTEFVPLHTYRIYKAVPTSSYTSWSIRSRDRQMDAKRTVRNNPFNGEALSPENPWIVQGTPGEIVQAMFLFGAGRALEEIDRAALVTLDSGAEGQYKCFRPYLFSLAESFEIKQFLETEIFRSAGLYPVVTNTGKYSVRASRPPAGGSQSVFTFDQHNIIVLPEIDRMPVVNEIIFRLDHDGSEFLTQLTFIDATSVSEYGRGGQHVIDSLGLRSELGGSWVCQDTAARLFRRFAGTPTGLRGGAPLLRVEAFLLSLPVWAGDYVNVTHPLMPNLLNGELGVTNRLMEVIDRQPNYGTGRMQYRLLDTGLTGLPPAHLFSPSGNDFIIGTSELY